jgi:hypothetical protein
MGTAPAFQTEVMMTDRFSALSAMTEADFERLKTGILQRFERASPASLKRDLLQMIQEDFAEHGRTSICINGKLWEFVADQPINPAFRTRTGQTRLRPTGSTMQPTASTFQTS